MKFHVAKNSEGRRIVHTTAADAKSDDPQFVSVDIPTDKPGLHEWYQKQLDEIDAQAGGSSSDTNEETDSASAASFDGITSGAVTADLIMAMPPDQRAMLIEDLFDKLPTMTQLHYGARAIEEARDAIGGPAIHTTGRRFGKQTD